MKTKRLYGFAVSEIVFGSIVFTDIVNDAMRVVAFLAAIATLIMAVLKFLQERKLRQKQSKLMDLQIEEQVRTLNKLRDETNK